MWHIVNVFISAGAFATMMALFWYTSIVDSDTTTPCEKLVYKKDEYRYVIGRTAQHCFHTYFDLFLLYLLHRYSSPFFSHGLAVPRVSDSAFDYEDTRASLNPEELNKTRQDAKKEFLEYLISDMVSEICTEEQIANEFLGASHRGTLAEMKISIKE